DNMRFGYDRPSIDAIVFSGGSSYGLEAAAGVATALKDDGVRSGNSSNIAGVKGAIIYDFGGHRLNEIYPDKRLGQAALHAARSGVFPQGAQGAGRVVIFRLRRSFWTGRCLPSDWRHEDCRLCRRQRLWQHHRPRREARQMPSWPELGNADQDW